MGSGRGFSADAGKRTSEQALCKGGSVNRQLIGVYRAVAVRLAGVGAFEIAHAGKP
jgi:hypothetical protein